MYLGVHKLSCGEEYLVNLQQLSLLNGGNGSTYESMPLSDQGPMDHLVVLCVGVENCGVQ